MQNVLQARPRPWWLNILAWLGLIIAAIAITIWVLSPLALDIRSVTIDIGDAFREAWTLHWLQRALVNPQLDAFAAPVSFPATNALATYQPLFTSAVLSLPLFLAGVDPLQTYTYTVLGSFTLSFLSMAVLIKYASRSWLAAIVAGILYAFSSMRMAHLAQLNLLSGFWTPLVLMLIIVLWEEAPRRVLPAFGLGLLLGLSVAAQVLADAYTGMFMVWAVVLLGICLLVRRRWTLSWYSIGAFGLALLIAAALSLPIYLRIQQAWQNLDLTRTIADHYHFSASVESYVQSFNESQLPYDLDDWYTPVVKYGAEAQLWPGLITLLLAGIGLILAPMSLRRLQIYALLLTAMAFFFSLGPSMHWTGRDTGQASNLYLWIFEHVPFFSGLRVPSRWGLLVHTGLVIMAGIGLAGVLRFAAGQKRGVQVALYGVGLLIVCLALLDSNYGPIQGSPNIVDEPVPQVYGELAKLGPGAMFEWPLDNKKGTLHLRYAYYAMYHERPLINTAGSIIPQRYKDLVDQLPQFPGTATNMLLYDLGARYVLFHRWEINDWDNLYERLQNTPNLRLIGTYEADRHYLYEILPYKPTQPAATATVIQHDGKQQLAVQVGHTLWLREPQHFYDPAITTTIRIERVSGAPLSFDASLTPGLLPGLYTWPLTERVDDAKGVWIGDTQLAWGRPPEQLVVKLVEQPQLVGEVGSQVKPGELLACRAFGKGRIDIPGLVLSVNLVDGDWNFYAKRDFFFKAGQISPQQWSDEEFVQLPCELVVPADLKPGEYFIAFGLFDPGTNNAIPIRGADGVEVPFLWRIPTPISVGSSR